MNYHDREKAYRAAPGLNQSTLKPYREGAAIGRYKELNPPKQTDSQSVGVLVERMVYCPDDPRCVVKLAENVGTKGYHKSLNEAAREAGNILVSESDLEPAKELAALIQQTVDLSAFQHGAGLYADGRKCLFDFLNEATDEAYDLKVTEHKLTEKWLSKSVEDFGWHMQQGWYEDIYQRVTGRKLTYRIIVASAVKPYRVEVIDLPRDDVAIGLAECEALAAYRAKCIASNHFPHLPLGKVGLSNYYRPFEGTERKARDVAVAAELANMADVFKNIDAGNLPDMGW